MDPDIIQQLLAGRHGSRPKKPNLKKYFDIMGLKKGATQQEVNQAYIELSKKNKGNDAKIKELEEAYAALCDADLEAAAKEDSKDEEKGDSHGEPKQNINMEDEGIDKDNDMENMEDMGGDIGDIFELLRGGGRRGGPKKRQKPKMKPIGVALEVTLDEIYKGETKKMEVPRVRLCKGCKGKGCKAGGKVTKCSACKGRGAVMKVIQMGPGMCMQTQGKCDECDGAGESISENDKCTKCGGKKHEEEKKEFTIKLDPGVPHDHHYPFPGEGNELPETLAGDLIFVVKQKDHPRMKRRGADLLCEQELTLSEALTGGKFTFEHLCGKKMNLHLKKGKIVKPGEVMVIDGLGMPIMKSPGSFGKLYLVATIKFPKKLEDERLDSLLDSLVDLKSEQPVDEKISEKVKMVEFKPMQKNPREDGDTAPHPEDEHDHAGDGEPQGVPCHAQ